MSILNEYASYYRRVMENGSENPLTFEEWIERRLDDGQHEII